MDTRGLFEMAIIFAVLLGSGSVVLDKGQSETARTQAFALIAGLVGIVCPSPVSNALKRVKEKNAATSEDENKAE